MTSDDEKGKGLVLPNELPEVGDLPAGSRVVHRYNRFFVGREEELLELARLLQRGETAAIGEVAGITGLGGVGKSQLAVALVYRYGRFFPGGVFWVSMANPDAIETEIALCGGLQGMNLRPDFVELPLPDQVTLVQREWLKPVARLLIFDNCEEERLLEEFRPKAGGCRVMVTSRRGNWLRGTGVQMVALATLPRGESVALLQKHVPDAAAADLDSIAQELGDLPLALHLAGSYLETYQEAVTPDSYLEQLQEKGLLNHPSLQGKGANYSPTQHELHVWRTFAVSYAGLNVNHTMHRLAKGMLACAAWLALGEPIPVWLLDKVSEHVGEYASRENTNEGEEQALKEEEVKLQLVEARRKLIGLGLLMRDGEETVTMHRLVGVYVQGLEGTDRVLNAVEDVILGEATRINEEQRTPEPLVGWRGHLQVVTARAGERGDEQGAALGNALGHHLWLAGDYRGARPLLERALRVREQVLGVEHPDTAMSLNNLGQLLKDMGELVDARPLLERALRIREQVLGAEHPHTAQSLNNLGGLLKSMGDLAGARPLLERALAINEQVLGAEHPDTATSLNNLGLLLKDMRNRVRARLLLERALRIREQVLGAEHPDTAMSLNNLAGLLQDMGDLAGARPLYEQALRIREQVLGKHHPYTKITQKNLEGLKRAVGKKARVRGKS